MPKQKTRKSVAKRFKKTGRNKIRRTAAGGAHLATGKSRGRKRRVRAGKMVAKADYKRVLVGLPY